MADGHDLEYCPHRHARAHTRPDRCDLWDRSLGLIYVCPFVVIVYDVDEVAKTSCFHADKWSRPRTRDLDRHAAQTAAPRKSRATAVKSEKIAPKRRDSLEASQEQLHRQLCCTASSRLGTRGTGQPHAGSLAQYRPQTAPETHLRTHGARSMRLPSDCGTIGKRSRTGRRRRSSENTHSAALCCEKQSQHQHCCRSSRSMC